MRRTIVAAVTALALLLSAAAASGANTATPGSQAGGAGAHGPVATDPVTSGRAIEMVLGTRTATEDDPPGEQPDEPGDPDITEPDDPNLLGLWIGIVAVILSRSSESVYGGGATVAEVRK